MIGGIVSLVLVIAVGVLAQLNNGPTAPLPSSVEGCNATLPLDGRLHSAGFAYDIEPADGAVSLALQHHVDDGTVTHLLSIATKDGWNGQGMEQNFYR